MYIIQTKDTEEYLTLIYLGEVFWTASLKCAYKFKPGSEELKKVKDFLTRILKIKIRLIKI